MVSMEFAYEYFTNERLFSEAFLQAEDNKQYQALNMAKNQILSQRFKKYEDENKEILIKKAVCEQALYLLDTMSSQRHKLISQGFTSFSVEGLSEHYDLNKTNEIICKEAKELIKPYLIGGVVIC